MKRIDPEFDQWTDQNHLPYRPLQFGQSQGISKATPSPRSMNLLWRSVRKLFGRSHAVDHITQPNSKPFLS